MLCKLCVGKLKIIDWYILFQSKSIIIHCLKEFNTISQIN